MRYLPGQGSGYDCGGGYIQWILFVSFIERRGRTEGPVDCSCSQWFGSVPARCFCIHPLHGRSDGHDGTSEPEIRPPRAMLSTDFFAAVENISSSSFTVPPMEWKSHFMGEYFALFCVSHTSNFLKYFFIFNIALAC